MILFFVVNFWGYISLTNKYVYALYTSNNANEVKQNDEKKDTKRCYYKYMYVYDNLLISVYVSKYFVSNAGELEKIEVLIST